MTSQFSLSVQTITRSSPTAPPTSSIATIPAVNEHDDETGGYVTQEPLQQFNVMNKGVTLVLVGETTATDWTQYELGKPLNLTVSHIENPPNYTTCVLQLASPDKSKNFCFTDREVFTWDWPRAARSEQISNVVRVSSVTVDIGASIDPFNKGQAVQNTAENMVRNLAALSAVAKLIIPDLRESTQKETADLRQYYKKVFRKV